MKTPSKKSTRNLEEIMIVVSKILPPLPKLIIKTTVKIIPKIAFWGSFLIFILIIYFIFFDPQTYGLDTLEKINYYLFCFFCIILAFALFLTRRPLQKKLLKGWRTIYYLSLILLLLFTITLNFAGLIAVFFIFYFLTQIRQHYE